jgi:transposase
MSETATRETRETWVKRIERWKDSGLSAKEYASEIGISEPSLKWWKWKLAREAAGTTAPQEKRRRVVSATNAAVTFVEVPRAPVSRSSIELVLPSRIRVRLRDDFDSAALERLLGVLGAR